MADEEQELNEGEDEQPAQTDQFGEALDTAGRIGRGAKALARGQERLGTQAAGKAIGGALSPSIGKAGKFLGTVLGPGSKVKLGALAIIAGIFLLAGIVAVLGLALSALARSGGGGTTPQQAQDLTRPETLETLDELQCLQEEARQDLDEDGQLGPDCTKTVLAAIERFKQNAERQRSRIPAETTDGKQAIQMLDELLKLAEGLTETRDLKQLAERKQAFDAKLADFNRLVAKFGLAAGFAHLDGKASDIELAKIRVVRNQGYAQLIDQTGVVIGSAPIGIGDGSGDGGNYLKTSGFFSGDHVTPLGNFSTGYQIREANQITSGQFGSEMGYEVIEYTDGVATGRGLLFHSGPPSYDQREKPGFTYGCVRFYSDDMRIFYDVVHAQGKSIPIEIVDES